MDLTTAGNSSHVSINCFGAKYRVAPDVKDPPFPNLKHEHVSGSVAFTTLRVRTVYTASLRWSSQAVTHRMNQRTGQLRVNLKLLECSMMIPWGHSLGGSVSGMFWYLTEIIRGVVLDRIFKLTDQLSQRVHNKKKSPHFGALLIHLIWQWSDFLYVKTETRY